MPRIFDNIEQKLLDGLSYSLEKSFKADFCVGYFNLRGWKVIDELIEKYSGGEDNCCRLLIGMQKLPSESFHELYSLNIDQLELDNQLVLRLKKKMAQEFKEQLTYGYPTNADEAGLRRLASQLKKKKVIVKLFLRHQLHAKLYLAYRDDKQNPKIGYVGSSNLTLSGLSHQGELNVDVLEHDACDKLEKWFNNRWEDRWCIDISKELEEIINTSWAGQEEILPYYIYLKMAYHLSREARSGLNEFKIPNEFKNKLLDFQVKAVQIAAHHLHKRDGVMIGDVVGLGKTLMATALAKIFDDDFSFDTLIIAPKNLVKMWEDYRDTYRLRAKVLSSSVVINQLEVLKRYRVVIIDESHNLRNREGKRYKSIQQYINLNECKVILLTATPFNKTFTDLSNQLRLFINEDQELSIRPERLISELTEPVFLSEHQCSVRSIAAFEKSEFPDDWRDVMKLYMVRRTRSFIKDNYAKEDSINKRKYLTFADGSRSYFPDRIPKKITFRVNEKDKKDQYAMLFSNKVVDTINSLNLPRYGLGNYIETHPENPPTAAEDKIIKDLSRAGKRLMGFCRTNLFKRLESCGFSFLLSVSRHLVRNNVYTYALKNNLPIPIGKQGSELVETDFYSSDDKDFESDFFNEENGESESEELIIPLSMKDYEKKAEVIYNEYKTVHKSKFRWLNQKLFIKKLKEHLARDNEALLNILIECGEWNTSKDMKLNELENLISNKHPSDKILIFSQFADTVEYLGRELKKRGVSNLEPCSGNAEDPTVLAYKFSPESNYDLLKEKNLIFKPEEQIRVLIATDVLSEGQNLQDAHIIVNFDLPWAIIRLIQRAGRVDRIGQKAEEILCYSFIPAEGVDKIIKLRTRVTDRLKTNAEIVGTDEVFFEDEAEQYVMLENLYNEKAGILDDEDDSEVDLTSQAYQIWKNAIDKNPEIEKVIHNLPNVVYSTKENKDEKSEDGVLVYTRTSDDNDILSRIDTNGNIVTQSQLAILKAAECSESEKALPKNEKHHELVKIALDNIAEEEKSVGGQLGKPSSAKHRTYLRLKSYIDTVKDTLFDSSELQKTLDELYRFPLFESAKDVLNRQLKTGITDNSLADLVLSLRENGKLCIISDEQEQIEPQIICSMGMFKKS